MNATDLAFAGVAGQAELLRGGEVGVRELVQTSLDRIAALDPQLNAFRSVYAERALLEADQAQARLNEGDARPLLGIPLAIKDNTDVAGDVTPNGTNGYGPPAQADAEVVRLARAAGAIIVGKTHVPPLCAMTCTESATFGITRNPWDVNRTSGGSSGGSATAVSSGMVPAALATDGLGSIRVPAAFCGLFGLKPQRGRVSLAPHAEHWHGLSVAGWVTRSVRDSAILYDATMGTTPVDRDAAPAPARSFAESAASAPGKLRIALSLKLPPGVVGVTVDDECRRAVLETGELLRSLGHEVVERDPDYGPTVPAGLVRVLRGVADDLAALPHPERVDRRFRRIARAAALIPDSVVQRSRDELEPAIARRIGLLFEEFDVLIQPITSEPAFEVERWEGRGAIWTLNGNPRVIPFTGAWNVTGQPAAAVPSGWTSGGLPLSTQLIGRPNDEGVLLSLAAQIEAERPWAERRPPVS